MSIFHFLKKGKFSGRSGRLTPWATVLLFSALFLALLVPLTKLIRLEKARSPIQILQNNLLTPGAPGGMYEGSRKGGTYFFPWCPLAEKLQKSDQIWFDTREQAEKSGFKAGRCNGM